MLVSNENWRKIILETFGFYIFNRHSSTSDLQKGIIRTNCLDCLDRTNVTQYKISEVILQEILKHLRVNESRLESKLDSNGRFINNGYDTDLEWDILTDAFKRLWTSNGDKLSQQYTGTNSNISGVIEKGKQGITGKLGQMFTGIQRFVANNWTDHMKNDCIKILLNKHPLQKPYGIQNKLMKVMTSLSQLYISTRELKVAVLTWNLAGNPPPENLNLSGLLVPSGSQPSDVTSPDDLPDIYVVGLQEMVNLDILGSLACTKDVERMHGWENIIMRSLNHRAAQTQGHKGLKYGCLLRKVMLGCYIMLFIRSDNYNSIKNMHTVKIKTGTSGYTANKGSVALRFNVEDTSFMFMNCHLCSG